MLRREVKEVEEVQQEEGLKDGEEVQQAEGRLYIYGGRWQSKFSRKEGF